MRFVLALVFSLMAMFGASLASAAPVEAGCAPVWSPWGGGERCDGPVQPNGTFERCDTVGAFGLSTRNCYIVDANNLAGNLPRVGP